MYGKIFGEIKMKGVCENHGKVEGVKKPFSIFFLILTGGVYAIYRLIFVSKNKCPMCGLKISRK